MKAILQRAVGAADSLYIGTTSKPLVRSEALLVRVKAAGLNRADIVQRQGKYPPPPGDSDILGLEMAGVVEEVGSNVTGWEIGDRVMALLGGGGYAQCAAGSFSLLLPFLTHLDVVVPASQAMPVPPSLSFEEAAAIPEAFLTAFQTLFSIGKVNQDGPKDVLIHAAGRLEFNSFNSNSSNRNSFEEYGVGTAAVQLLRQVPSVQSFVTAGTSEKIDFCRWLGAKSGANYKEGSWHTNPELLKATRTGKGFDLILDPVGQSYFQADIDSLNPEGMLVIIGFLSGSVAPKINLVPLLAKRLRIQGTTLRTRSPAYKAQLVTDFLAFSTGMFEDKRLRPIVSRVFPWTEIAAAHHYMEEDKNIGKIIINTME